MPSVVTRAKPYASALALFAAVAVAMVGDGAARADTVPPTTEVPARADAFADSIGVNVDLVNIASQNVGTAAKAVLGAGIRHVRIAILQNDPPYDAVVSSFLSTSHARALGITNCAPSLGPYPLAAIDAQDVRAFSSSIGGGLEAYEAMNEPDSRARADVNWVVDLKSCMRLQEGAIANMPFLAPAIADQYDMTQKLGNIGSMVTSANFHRYFAGRNPGTSGWGGTSPCGTYGALLWAMCEASVTAPGRPAYVTETGYNSETEVDQATQAKYLLRALLLDFNAGIVRSYAYCLIGYTGADGFGGTGLLQPSLAPKPAYRALASAVATLSDAGTDSLARGSVTYSLAGPPSMGHALFQRRDGTYVLALWNEAQSWNPTNGGEIRVAPQLVQVTTSFPITSASAAFVNDSGNLQSSATASVPTGFSLSIDDHVTFVRFKRS